MTLKYILTAISAALFLTACNDKDGDWDPMKWEKASYASIKIDGKKYIEVPRQGGTYTFSCKNYQGFLLSAFNITTYSDDSTMEKQQYNNSFGNDWNSQHMSIDGCTVDVDGNTMTVNFDNSEAHRIYEVDITAGDIFDTFRFVQQ